MKQVFGASALAVLLTFGGQTVSAQDFGKGLEAAQVGDFETALREWQPLADQGNASAQVMLGWMYRTGRGVSQDNVEAAKWYRLAADQGNSNAQTSLGMMYGIGRGVPQDYSEAAKRYRLAAEQGNADAQANLGWMYDNGRGVPQDYADAAKWYRLAAEQGDADARFYLGTLYDDGQGVEKDNLYALMWFNIADQSGIEFAANARCLIPRFDGAILTQAWKEALWDKFVTGAPRQRTPSELQYSD
ncbi:tetratricopeptide repeat protein, partial [Tateyamaria sp.]|uniref:tetratricopeptide repeat protein n=2 Tax=Tateyamaria sp. TaxID=1929288 RepID=UPI0032DCE67F